MIKILGISIAVLFGASVPLTGPDDSNDRARNDELSPPAINSVDELEPYKPRVFLEKETISPDPMEAIDRLKAIHRKWKSNKYEAIGNCWWRFVEKKK